MRAKEEIALEITKAVISKISFNANDVNTLPYEIFNSIYQNIKTFEDEPINS